MTFTPEDHRLVARVVAYARAIGAPAVFDTFGGEGGIAVGYAMGGAVVLGVENNRARVKRYPFPVIYGDALEAILTFGHLFDLGHGSPTCTGYSRGTAAVPDRIARYPRLIPAVREAFLMAGIPYVIENVADARRELVDPVLLCGRMFALGATDDDGTALVMDRHRLFETSWRMEQPEHLPHDRTLQVAGSYGGARRDKVEARTVRKGGYVPASVDVQRSMLGTPWMSEKGCQLSVPPVFALTVLRSWLASPAAPADVDEPALRAIGAARP